MEEAHAAASSSLGTGVHAAYIEEWNVQEDHGVDEVHMDDYPVYSQSLSHQLCKGYDEVGDGIMDFLQVQASSLEENAAVNSNFPPFDNVSIVNGRPQTGESERIMIEISLHRYSDTFQVHWATRTSMFAPAGGGQASASSSAPFDIRHPSQAQASSVGGCSFEASPDGGNGQNVQSNGLPFEPPDEVKKLLRPEDWQAITSAWQGAEEQAMAWARGDIDDFEDGAQEAHDSLDSFASPHLQGSMSEMSSRQRRPKKKKKEPAWNEDFGLLGKDSNYPPPLRRYFDRVPAESSVAKEAIRPEVARLHGAKSVPDVWSKAHPSYAPDISEATKKRMSSSGAACHEVLCEKREQQWINGWEKSCSEDNPMLHPHLRHYFDRRGLEASYRMRPFINACTPVMRPRTPRRPSTREKIMRVCASEPKIIGPGNPEDNLGAAGRVGGEIPWSRRCFMYGCESSTKINPFDGGKIPWVMDHHRTEAEDNEGVHPLLRHSFDKAGLESSFRQRGRHYGRPLKVCGADGHPGVPTDPAERKARGPSHWGNTLEMGSRRSSGIASEVSQNSTRALAPGPSIGQTVRMREATQLGGAMAMLAKHTANGPKALENSSSAPSLIGING